MFFNKLGIRFDDAWLMDIVQHRLFLDKTNYAQPAQETVKKSIVKRLVEELDIKQFAVFATVLEVSEHKLLNRCGFKLTELSSNPYFAGTQYKTSDGVFSFDDVITVPADSDGTICLRNEPLFGD